MQNACLVFVGSLNREAPYFQGARGVGLSVYSFDEETLETRKLTETSDVDNPTFLSVTPDGSHIYANSEVFAWREGMVSAYRFDRQTATLSLHQQAADPWQHHGAQHHHAQRDEAPGGQLRHG